MANSKVTFLFYVLLFALFIQIVIGDSLFQVCSKASGRFSSKSRYQRNLNTLLGAIKSRTAETGFINGFVGQNPDRVFGLAQCRADVSKNDCQSCMLNATRDVLDICRNNKAAMIWFDNCFLRYSDSQFSGTVDTRDGVVLINRQNASNPKSFSSKVTRVLSQLAEEALVSPKSFAASKKNIGKSQKLFGLVECTRDLSSTDCKTCIDILINDAQRDAITNAIGGRIITANCNIRFETFPFFNV